jgi:membrane protein implicated in regulation of membrane protease activity
MAALTFGVSGPAGPVPALTLAVGATIFLVISIAAHIAARRLLRRLKP